MTSAERFALPITSNPHVPLTLRRKLAKLCIPLDGRAFETELSGKPFQGVLDNYIEWVVYSTNSYFEYTYINLLRSLVSGGVAIDVGANVGNHTHAFSAFFDQVHSFEPFGRVADRLEAKAAHLPNVSVHRIALGAEPATLKFATPTTVNLGTGRIDDDGDIEVPVMRGDDFVSESVDGSVNFIKIDVEGHELEVLAGLEQTIARQRPVVIFEAPIYLRKEPGRSLSEAFDYFPEDYQFVALRGQSTFPVQASLPNVLSIDRGNPRITGKVSYFIAFGPERGFEVRGRKLEASA